MTRSDLLVLVGHPGLEPGANGLRTQRHTAHKALLLSDPDTRTRPIPVTKGHVSTYSGHRDRVLHPPDHRHRSALEFEECAGPVLKPFLRSLPGPSVKTDEAARPVPGR